MSDVAIDIALAIMVVFFLSTCISKGPAVTCYRGPEVECQMGGGSVIECKEYVEKIR